MLHLRPLVVKDTGLFLGQEAFRLLVPADWRASGHVDWRIHLQYPAGLRVTAYNPAGLEAVYSYPQIPFVAGVIHLPQGAHYLGNEVRPHPGDVTNYVRFYLLPRYRPEVRSYRVVTAKPLPDWAKSSAFAQAPGWKIMAGQVRIAYSVNGQAVEEELNVMLDSLYDRVNMKLWWGTEWATSVRAAPGKLDVVRGIHQTMVSSFRLDLSWYGRMCQAADVVRQIMQNESDAAVIRSKILAQANGHVTAVIRKSYEHRQAALDRIHARFSEYIRGVQTFRGSDGRTVQLPSRYRYAWVNNRGEYVMSDDATFNPGVRWHGDWHVLRLVR